MKFNTNQVTGYWHTYLPGYPKVIDTSVLENRVQTRVVNWIARHVPKAMVWHPPVSKFGKGVPDLIVWLWGYTFKLELKRWLQTPTKIQMLHLKRSVAAGCVCAWAMDAATAVDLVQGFIDGIEMGFNRSWTRIRHVVIIPGVKVDQDVLTGEAYFDGRIIHRHPPLEEL